MEAKTLTHLALDLIAVDGEFDTFTGDSQAETWMAEQQDMLYAQDHWQVLPNLTIDYGVRYQYMPAMIERDDHIPPLTDLLAELDVQEIRARREQRNTDHPYYWGAFIAASG